MTDRQIPMVTAARARRVAVVGRLGVYPMVKLTLPARRIVAFLALHDDPVSRSYAASRLWPDVTDHDGRGNFRRSLWQVPDGWVTCWGDDISLDADVDYPRARRIAAAALSGEPLSFEQIRLLSEDLLPGWHEEWALGEQDSFRMLRLQALEAACRSMTRAGDLPLAVQAGSAALAAEPLRESAAAALIEALLQQGNRYEAARFFGEFCVLLKRELGVDPAPAMVRRLAGFGIGSVPSEAPQRDGHGDGTGRSPGARSR
jgi:DNA-binding SARP family transcriptional activator